MTTWSTMSRGERLDAVQAAAAEGKKAAALARELKTGFWAIVGVAMANGVVLVDLPDQPSDGHPLADRPPQGTETAPVSAPEAAPPATAAPVQQDQPLKIFIDDTARSRLERLAADAAMPPHLVAAALLMDLLADDAAAHGEAA